MPKALGIEGKKGAFVAQIFLNSPAAKGGIQAGDFIIALNGKPVKDVDQHAFLTVSNVMGVYGEGFDTIKLRSKK